MNTHEPNNAHIRQQAARARGLARFPGFASILAPPRTRPPACVCCSRSTADLPTGEWLGNLPQPPPPPPREARRRLAGMASAHAARVSALTASPRAHACAVAIPHGIGDQQQQQQQAPHAWQQQQAVHFFVVHSNQLATSLLQQQQTDRLRKYGLDLAAIASQHIKTSEQLEEYERKVDATRKSLTPRSACRMAMEASKGKIAKVQKRTNRTTTTARGMSPEEKAQALEALEEMGPERRARAFERLVEKLDKDAKAKQK